MFIELIHGNNSKIMFYELCRFWNKGAIYCAICRDLNVRRILQFYPLRVRFTFILRRVRIRLSTKLSFRQAYPVLTTEFYALPAKYPLDPRWNWRHWRHIAYIDLPVKQVFPSYRARIVFRCNKDSVSLEGWATFAPWKRTSLPSPDW